MDGKLDMDMDMDMQVLVICVGRFGDDVKKKSRAGGPFS